MQRDERALVAAVLLIAAAAVALYWVPVGPAPATEQFGYVPDPKATAEFLRELPQPLFADAGAEIMREAKGRDTFLWRLADKAHQQVYAQPFGPWKQGIGDCVAFGWGMGSYVGTAVDWSTGAIPEPPLLVDTSGIYGGSRCESRGIEFAGWSDGSYGAAAARWVAGLKNGTGGILYRKKYGAIDLTEYDPQRSKEWGAYGCGGRGNTTLDKIANQHTARGVALIRNFDEAAAAIEAGMPVVVCCGLSWSTTRDADGFAARTPQGWAHCQCIIGVRYAKNGAAAGMKNPRDGLAVINSWGARWQGGGKNPADQPDGCYWITREDADAALKGGDSFCIAGVNGWRWRDINHTDWQAQPPADPNTVAIQK